MKDLKQKYIDFINWYDPYWDAYADEDEVINITLPEMLYNLEEIRKGFNDDYMDSEVAREIIERLDEVIKIFKDAGIKKAIIGG